MRTKIISAFPGTGKTYYYNKNKETTLDSDSSNFSWIKDSNGENTKDRNPDFPKNYISHIKNNIGKYEYIFVSSHKEVRDALLNESIFFYLVYPNRKRKAEFVKRYQDRGNAEGFINLVNSKWDDWIDEIEIPENGFKLVTMISPNLENELRNLDKFPKKNFLKNVTINFRKDHSNEINKMMELLRRTYDIIEMSHLTDGKMVSNYISQFRFPRSLGSDIFNYLQAKDSFFRKFVIQRQKRYRAKQKRKNENK